MTGGRRLLRRVEPALDHPLIVVAGLALVGLIVRQAWWTTQPLSAGDWHWVDRGRLLQWFPWPTVWDPTQGFAGQDRFLDAFRFPVYAVSGFIGTLGGAWTLAEKLVYFAPYAVLLPMAGWLFAREVMGRTRWALLAPVILLANSYLLLEGDVHTPLTIAEAVGLLTLVAFMRAMRRRSVPWAVVTGLLLGVCTMFDIRPAYLTGLLMVGYMVVLAIADPDLRRNLRRALVAGGAAVVFALTQAYWWIPLLAYGTAPHLPTPQAPNFNILTLEHGLAGVSAFWTGGRPAELVQAPLNPALMLLPLLAMVPLLRRRVSVEVAWLGLAVLLAAFFAKTNTPPLGALYDWMYTHVPGWRLFREGSKFLYIVGAGYAVLVPLGLRELTRGWSAAHGTHRRGALAMRGAGVVALLGVLGISAGSIAVLESGALDTTTQPTSEPASFSQLASTMSADPETGAILWFGSPAISAADGRNHRFIIASATHSIENLTGSLSATQVNHLDVMQSFCGDPLQPYCYLDSAVFPYLAHISGAGYIVAPGGESVGVLPNGITRSWLRSSLIGMFGQPRVLGSGDTALDLWHISGTAPAVTAAPAVALVDSGPWSLAQALPALQALDLPAVFTKSLAVTSFPPAAATLPDSVVVEPRLNGGCTADGGDLAVLAESTSTSLPATVGGAAASLPLLSPAGRLPGWSAFGPISPAAGPVTIESATIPLGPCIGWSTLAASALAERPATVGDISISGGGERIAAPLAGADPAWLELRRSYDPGWRLAGARPTGVADGFFNLYRGAGAKHSAVQNGKVVFQFSTTLWERVGQGVALVSLLACLAFLVWRGRRPYAGADSDQPVVEAEPTPELTSRFASLLTGVGIALIAVSTVATALAWFGVPSHVTAVTIADDPYGLAIAYAAAAIAVLVLGLLLRLVESLLGRRRPATDRQEQRLPAGAAVAGTVALMLLLSACEGDGSGAASALQSAQANGATSGSVAAASLDEARQRGAAAQPNLCIADYTRALVQYSYLPDAFAGRANCYLAQGRGAGAAVHDLDTAIALDPNRAALYLNRAIARRAAGDVNGATADYRAAASLPSASTTTFLQAIDGLISANDGDDAAAAVQAGRARYAGSPLLELAIADLDRQQGLDLDARRHLLAAVALGGSVEDRTRVLTSLCHYDVIHHDYATAVTDCSSVVAISANGTGAYDDRSVAELALGRPARAIDDLSRAIGVFSGNVGPAAQASGIDGFGIALLLEARARAEVENRQPEPARADFRRALAALPPNTPDFAARVKGELQSVTG